MVLGDDCWHGVILAVGSGLDGSGNKDVATLVMASNTSGFFYKPFDLLKLSGHLENSILYTWYLNAVALGSGCPVNTSPPEDAM